MRLREREMPLDPEVERELEAIDRALAGEPVDPDLEVLAELARELRDERPEPDAAASRPSSTSGPRTGSPAPSDRLGRLRRRVSGASRRPPRARHPGPGWAAASCSWSRSASAICQSGEIGGGGGVSTQPAPTASKAEPDETAAGGAARRCRPART